MARDPLNVRFTPWIHAALVGTVAGLAYLEGVASRFGSIWTAFAIVVVSRGLGAFLARAPKLPRRRPSQTQLLEELKTLTSRLIGATHGLTGQAAVIVGEIDLLLEEYHRDKNS